MIKFETINELTLKVTTTGNDVIFTKTGAFIAGDCNGNTNYRFEKVLLGPQKSLAQAALGSLMRRVTGENIPLTKVTMNGPSETYYAESQSQQREQGTFKCTRRTWMGCSGAEIRAVRTF